MQPNIALSRRLLLGICLMWAIPAVAVKPHSLDDIRRTVEEFVSAEYRELGQLSGVEVGRLDPRLRLAQCEQPLTPFLPHGRGRGSHVTVGVRCAGAKPWTLYVPAQITVHVEVLTAAGTLARGSVLKESDLRPIARDIAALPHGYYRDARALVGMQLRRPLRPGEVISPAMVERAALIERGQALWLVGTSGGVSVSMKGEALEDGALGERIQVRNLSSKRIIEAEVTGKNEARVAL